MLKAFEPFFTKEYMMGPNTIRLLYQMVQTHPLPERGRILDLGCGTGLSSLYLARSTDAGIFAVDLWCSAADNYRRFRQWNVDGSVIPIHADARDLPFADEYFDAVVSVDAYHYFGCDPAYFTRKLLPLVKPGGWILITVPGLHEEYGANVPAEMLEWAGDEHVLFHSCEWWRDTIGADPAITSAEFLKLDDQEAWLDWFESGHEYALNDKRFFDKGVDRHMCFVMMAIHKA